MGTGLTTQSITVGSSGIYRVQTTNELGCVNLSDPTVVTVNKRDKAIINPTSVTTFCEGGSVILKGNLGMKNYLWSTGEITDQITVNKNSNIILTITNQNGCSSTSDTLRVTVLEKPKPTITPLSATTFCEGGAVVLKASEGKYYLWSNGDKSDQITVTKTGTYYVSVTNELGCSETSGNVIVTVNTPTVLTKIDNFQACINGGLVSLNKEQPTGGVYSGDGITANNFNPVIAGLGNHTITYTFINSNGCMSSLTFNIEVTPFTTIIPLEDMTVCEKDPPFALKIFTVPNNTTIQGQGVQNEKFNPGLAGIGTFIINYTLVNEFGCTSRAVQTIKVTPVPSNVIVTGSTQSCIDDMLTLTASSNISGNSQLSYNWYYQGQSTPFYSGKILNYKIAKTESIFVSAIVNAGTDCTSNLTEVKIVALNPTGDFSSNTNRIPLAGLIKFNSAINGALNYAWDFGDGNKSSEQNPVHYYYKEGKYTVILKAYSSAGCLLTVEKNDMITVDPDPIIITPPVNGTLPSSDPTPHKINVIYPNPIKSQYAKIRAYNNLSNSSVGTISIYSISGALLSMNSYDFIPGENNIDLKDISLLSSSTYYLFVLNLNGSKTTFKILKL